MGERKDNELERKRNGWERECYGTYNVNRNVKEREREREDYGGRTTMKKII